MTNSKIIVVLWVLVFSIISQHQAEAQVEVSQSVFGNGGAAISNSNYRILSTVGQTVIGRSRNTSNISNGGFWYQFVDLITSVEQIPNETLPTEFCLEQNYPNPFNPETKVEFQLPEASHVIIKIFNILGQEIRTVTDKQYKAGIHSVRWDGKDTGGNSVSSGVYLYKVQAGDFVQVRKMTVLR